MVTQARGATKSGFKQLLVSIWGSEHQQRGAGCGLGLIRAFSGLLVDVNLRGLEVCMQDM